MERKERNGCASSRWRGCRGGCRSGRVGRVRGVWGVSVGVWGCRNWEREEREGKERGEREEKERGKRERGEREGERERGKREGEKEVALSCG